MKKSVYSLSIIIDNFYDYWFNFLRICAREVHLYKVESLIKLKFLFKNVISRIFWGSDLFFLFETLQLEVKNICSVAMKAAGRIKYLETIFFKCLPTL